MRAEPLRGPAKRVEGDPLLGFKARNDAGSATASDHQSDGLGGGTSSKNVDRNAPVMSSNDIVFGGAQLTIRFVVELETVDRKMTTA